MRHYILHSATLNTDGELRIDCSRPYPTEQEAQAAQYLMLASYPQQFAYPAKSWRLEQVGNFARLACSECQAELQCHVQELPV